MVEVIVSITIVAILMSFLLPTLAAVQNRMVRTKCKNNLKNVNLCYIVYAQDFAMKFPWVTPKRDQLRQKFSYYGAFDTRELYCNMIIRSMLGFPEVLVSPCDPDRRLAMEQVGSHYRFKNFYPNNATSYGVCAGTPAPDVRGPNGNALQAQEYSANFTHTQTILTVTRNIVGPINDGDSLSNQTGGNPIGNPDHTQFATWVGANNSNVEHRNKRSMANLKDGFGQVGLADGSAHTYDLGKLAQQISKHHKDKGVEYRGVPSPIITTPNDPIPGHHKEWAQYGKIYTNRKCRVSGCVLPGAHSGHVTKTLVSTWKLYETGEKFNNQFYTEEGITYRGMMNPIDQPSYIWQPPTWLPPDPNAP